MEQLKYNYESTPGVHESIGEQQYNVTSIDRLIHFSIGGLECDMSCKPAESSLEITVIVKEDEIGREYHCVCLVITKIYVTGGANAGLFAVRARGRFGSLVALPN